MAWQLKVFSGPLGFRRLPIPVVPVRSEFGSMTQHQQKIVELVPKLLSWFAATARDLPWRHTQDPYAVFVSEIMLQQTQVKTVVPYWNRWMRELPDVRALAQAPEDRVLKLWEGLGYYTRARNLQRAAQLILERHAGEFPRHYDEVLALPGIGRYTAGAICSIAFNQPTPILDGNVIRVLTRLFGVDGDPREKQTNLRLWSMANAAVEFASQSEGSVARLSNGRSSGSSARRAKADAASSLPFSVSGACSALNQALMELGALVCTPKQPSCARCPLHAECRALATGQVHRLPNLPARAKSTERRFIAFALQHRGRWLLRQRPAQSVNAHLWEFPAFEIAVDDATLEPAEVLHRELRLRASPLEALPTIRHSITRYRITVAPFYARLPKANERSLSGRDGLSWRTPEEIEALALTSAHRRLWNSVSAKVG